jgi:hypothetical protein
MLILAEDHFWQSGTQFAVQVQASKAQVIVRQYAEFFERLFNGNLTAVHLR